MNKYIYVTILATTLLISSHAMLIEVQAANIVFDTSHKVIFQPQSEKHLGLKIFLSLFEKKGNKVEVRDTNLGSEALEKTDVLVIPGSMSPYSVKEINTIEAYVKNGGRLLVLLHIAPPLARLTERFGIILSNFVVSESLNTIDGQSQDFYTSKILPHPLTKGVKSVALYGSWAIMTEANAKLIASTSNRAWADTNRNRSFDVGEQMLEFGLIAATEFGRGKVVVVADDAPLANAFISKADNMTLAKNIVHWLTH